MLYATPIGILDHPLFWEKKFRIALLTFVTFVAMC